MTVNKNRDTVFTGSHDGYITSWDVATGESNRIGGVGHGNQMNGMVTLGESIFTCGIDNAIKEVNIMTKSFTNTNIKLASQPRGLAGNGPTLIVPCEKEVRSKKRFRFRCFLKDGTKAVACLSNKIEKIFLSIVLKTNNIYLPV